MSSNQNVLYFLCFVHNTQWAFRRRIDVETTSISTSIRRRYVVENANRIDVVLSTSNRRCVVDVESTLCCRRRINVVLSTSIRRRIYVENANRIDVVLSTSNQRCAIDVDSTLLIIINNYSLKWKRIYCNGGYYTDVNN